MLLPLMTIVFLKRKKKNAKIRSWIRNETDTFGRQLGINATSCSSCYRAVFRLLLTHLLILCCTFFLIQNHGRDPFNHRSNRSDREKRSTSKGGPVFSKLFRLDRTNPLSFGPKFPEILVEWIAPHVSVLPRVR